MFGNTEYQSFLFLGNSTMIFAKQETEMCYSKGHVSWFLHFLHSSMISLPCLCFSSILVLCLHCMIFQLTRTFIYIFIYPLTLMLKLFFCSVNIFLSSPNGLVNPSIVSQVEVQGLGLGHMYDPLISLGKMQEKDH